MRWNGFFNSAFCIICTAQRIRFDLFIYRNPNQHILVKLVPSCNCPGLHWFVLIFKQIFFKVLKCLTITKIYMFLIILFQNMQYYTKWQNKSWTRSLKFACHAGQALWCLKSSMKSTKAKLWGVLYFRPGLCDALDFTFVRGNGMWLSFICPGPYIQESSSLLSSLPSQGPGQAITGGFNEGETKAKYAFNKEDTNAGDDSTKETLNIKMHSTKETLKMEMHLTKKTL